MVRKLFFWGLAPARSVGWFENKVVLPFAVLGTIEDGSGSTRLVRNK